MLAACTHEGMHSPVISWECLCRQPVLSRASLWCIETICCVHGGSSMFAQKPHAWLPCHVLLLPSLCALRPLPLAACVCVGAELRRHKRGFMKLATKVTFARLQDGHTAKRMFIDYLREHLGT